MLVTWYLRRAVPWTALLGCCGAAALLAVVLDRVPSSAGVLLPALVACFAGSASFTFDEVSLPVVEVTPRGGTWRRTARLAAAGVPLFAWACLVAVRPASLPLARGSWFLVGLAGIALATGLAGLASGRGAVLTPSSSLAPTMALVVIGPVIVSALLGWASLYPIGDFTTGVLAVWLGLAAAGALACVAAATGRPGA